MRCPVKAKMAFVNAGYSELVNIYLKSEGGSTGYGMVIGKVVSSLTSEPVQGLTAEIVDLPISNVTNDQGEFTLYNVPEGEQLFRISGDSIIYYEKYMTVEPGGLVDIGILYLPID